MDANLIQRKIRWPSLRTFFLTLILIITGALSATALLFQPPTQVDLEVLEVGDVSPQDISAPITLSYDSEILTEQQRNIAAENVEPVFAPPNSSIARTQVNKLRAALAYIISVRMDEFASPEQKTADLAAMQDVNLSTESMQLLITFSENNWEGVQQETIIIIEQVMRSTIREDRLEETRRNIPALISLSLTEEDASVISELVAAFVAPNSLYSETLTETNQQTARDSVLPVVRRFVVNETVVQQGKVLTEVDIEALQQLGLLKPETTWQEKASAIALTIICFAYILLYMRHRQDLLEDYRTVLIMAVPFVLFLFGARLTIPNSAVIPFFYPLAGYGILISALISVRAGRALVLPLGILAGYGLNFSLELTLYYVLTGIFGVLALRENHRISSFFWSGVAITAAGASVILAYRLPELATDTFEILTLIGVTPFYALGSISLAILLQYFLAQALGLTTALQLIDLGRPDQPLLQFILQNAPGTFQHSLQIANLAEQAAELIHANALLTRVGSMYHDCGKARHPHMFIENQVPNSHNPHDDLTPLESSQIIVRHVTDGEEIAIKHRLPRAIIDFIMEHHGTLVTRYQYYNATEAAKENGAKINMADFQYPGPRPQSRETALVMLADGCEARTRAERPETEEDLNRIIKEVIDLRLAQGQLDDTDLTIRDLSVIVNSFTTTLKGIYHPRIAYPEGAEEKIPSQIEVSTKPR